VAPDSFDFGFARCGLDFATAWARWSDLSGIASRGGVAGTAVGNAVNCNSFTGGGITRSTPAGRTIQSRVSKIGK
jgi:hypothetical protein